MAFFGVGDHGGGPTRLAVGTIRDLSTTSAGSITFSGPVAYFEDLRGAVARGDADLPSVTGELQWHAVGCYSARASLKRGNARAEDALVAAEKMAELCRALTGRGRDVQEELAEAWRGVLFAQFHDALGGTTTDPATSAVEQLLTAAESRADRLATLAAHTHRRVGRHLGGRCRDRRGPRDLHVGDSRAPDRLQPSVVAGDGDRDPSPIRCPWPPRPRATGTRCNRSPRVK